MAAKSHVPKFGNWDADDVPYTICFDNARELKASGKTFNPNDPDDYPEAFTAATTISTANRRDLSQSLSSVKSVSADRRRNQTVDDDRIRRDQRPRQFHNHHHVKNRQEYGSSVSERMSSERSSSDCALIKEAKLSHGRAKSAGRQRNAVDGNGGLPPRASVPGRHGRNPNTASNSQNGGETASIPKFGSWDEKNPRSGEGYTAIFNKVKVEKQTATSNLQTVAPPPNQANRAVSRPDQGSTSFVSKICCCLCPK